MRNFDLLIPQRDNVGRDSWLWATVTGIDPLRIRLDGDDTSLTITPASLVKDLTVGVRVWVQLQGRRVIIHGASNSVSPIPAGSVQMFAGSTLPEGWLWCRGGTFSASQYTTLAATVGDTYGTHSGDLYYLPDFRARSPIGIGGAAVGGGSIGNVYSLGQKYGHESLAQHSHSVYDPGHVHHYHVGYSESVGGHNWTFSYNASGAPQRAFNLFGEWDTNSATTGISLYNAGSGDSGNVHPVLGMNFIIKT